MTGDPKMSFSVGFVVFIATLLVIVGLFTVGGPGVLDRTASYKIVVESANNVRKGTKVYLDGVVVGQVSSVRFQPFASEVPEMRNVVIEIAVASQNTIRIRNGSKAWLASDGLLGDEVVELKSGEWGTPTIPPGSEIPFVPRNLVSELIGEETQANAQQLLSELVRLLSDVQEGKGTLGQFLTDDELYRNTTALVGEAERSLSAFSNLLEAIQSGETPAAELLLGPDDAHLLSAALIGITDFAVRLGEDDSLASALGPDFLASLHSIASILDKVDRGDGTLGRFINDPTIADNLSNVFLGVREEPIVRNLIRNAEASGRRIFAESVNRDQQEARIRAAIAEQVPAGAEPVPAIEREEER